MGLQTLQYRIQILPRHAQQETAARLRIRQQCFLIWSGAVPCCEFVCKVKIVAAAARDATVRDELEDFRADHWHSDSYNLGANAAGATHRAQMPEQPKPGNVNRGF